MKTSSGLYLAMPASASALNKVNPKQELEQEAAIRDIDISFLEKAIGYDES